MTITDADGPIRPKKFGDSGYIATLDGWRAIAVMLVMGAHSVIMLKNNGSRPAIILGKIFNHAGYGVDIFFALSGFLITSILLKERDKFGQILLGRFYVRRVFRIIPPMAVYLAFVAGLASVGSFSNVHLSEIIASVLFARNYVDGSWYTGHFWSLSIEEHFYLVMPLLILHLRPKTLFYTSITAILICISIRSIEFSHPSLFQPLPQFRSENRVDALLWGSVFAQLREYKGIFLTLRKIVSPWATLAIVAVVSVIVTMIDIESVRRSILAITLPILIFLTVQHPSFWLGRLLELSVLRLIGRLSYSLYVWQMLFLVPAERPLGIFQSFPAAIVMPFILAFLSYRFVETPCIQIGRRISSKMRAGIVANPLELKSALDSD